MKTFYIQSFYQYPVTFSSIGKTMPARSAQGELKNICEVSENELQKLRNREPFFRELESKKKIRVLNHLPESYVPAAERINKATEEADKLREENEKLRAQLEANKKADVSKKETTEEVADASAEEKPAEEPKKKTTTKKK